ncbi:MAG: RluA family pseudouridine synthase [Alphaproteobacteria bacterium]|nr:RluA family pseudouridine synthase [Alphaproteobacteria bacterium]MBN2675291.1 RluA family pseudouridine synthase [Alphaproteobacteria bacterium]
MTESRVFKVYDNDIGQRLDKFLAFQLPEFSRSEIQKFNVEKLVNNKKVAIKFSDKIKHDEEFIVDVPTNQTVSEMPKASSDFELSITYEDDDIIVINKPRGIVMYPAAGNPTGTLVQNILSHTTLSGLGGSSRPGVVHRLDKDTSGVVILAKSDAAYRELIKTFSEHDLTRKYVAFVWGIPTWESAEITGNITRSSRNRQKMTMVKRGGKEAQTNVELMNIWEKDNISEIRCTLLTGRTHQIRVHLSGHGFPVLCDPVYGRGSSRIGSVKNPELLEFLKTNTGQMLHAEVLELKHPITGEQMRFKSRLPGDMQSLKDILNYTE